MLFRSGMEKCMEKMQIWDSTVSSPEKPENYPLYSVHIDLDSFILYNDESINEPELEDRDTNYIVEPTDLNIMATLDI